MKGFIEKSLSQTKKWVTRRPKLTAEGLPEFSVPKPETSDLKTLGSEFSIPFLEALPLGLMAKERVKEVPYSFVKKHEVFPFQEEDGTVLVALHDPYLQEPLDELEWLLKAKIAPYLCSREEILQAIHTTYERGDRAASELLAKLGVEGANKEEETI